MAKITRILLGIFYLGITAIGIYVFFAPNAVRLIPGIGILIPLGMFGFWRNLSPKNRGKPPLEERNQNEI